MLLSAVHEVGKMFIFSEHCQLPLIIWHIYKGNMAYYLDTNS